MRVADVRRETKETSISTKINLDGSGKFDISTSSGFLTHMLEQLSYHSMIDLAVDASGDEHIDMHHQAEDVAITLGESIRSALGSKSGINRYGLFYAPMDEALTRVALDLSGRPSFSFRVKFSQPRIGNLDTELFEHFFLSISTAIRCALHIDNLHGINNHHIAESCFKAFGRALRQSISIDERRASLNSSEPTSTKGVL